MGCKYVLYLFISTENVNKPKDFNAMKKQEMMMDRKVGEFD